MNEWPQLERQLILGTDTLGWSLTTASVELQDFLAQSQALAPARQWLHAAAALSLGRLVATALTPVSSAATPPALIQPIAQLSPKLTTLLACALQQQDLSLLTEYVSALSQQRLMLPPQFLVALFDLAQQQPELAALITGVLDARGLWLLGLKPEWQCLQQLLLQQSDGSLANLTGAILAHAVASGMQRDAAETVRQLELVWPQLNSKERQPTLDWLSQHLRPEWLPLLQLSLKSRSQAVRRQVVPLLLSLNDAKLQQQLQSWLMSVFQLEPNSLQAQRLELRLPRQFDPSWEDCAVVAKLGHLPTGMAVGPAAGWLYQFVSLVAPSQLAQWLGLDFPSLLVLVQTTDYADVLLEAFKDAACLRQDLAALSQLPVPPSVRDEWLSCAALRAPRQFAAQLLQHYLAQCLQPGLVAGWPEWVLVSRSLGQVSLSQAECWCQILLSVLTQQKQWYNYHNERLGQLAYAMPLAFYPQALQLLSSVLDDERLQAFLDLYRNRYDFTQALQAVV